MKFLFIYKKFFEGRRKEQGALTERALTERDILTNYLSTLPEFDDLIALYPKVEWKVEMSGRLTFLKSFANKRCSIEKDAKKWTIRMDEQTHTVVEDYNSAQEALRGMWTYQVSRQVRSPFEKEKVRNILKNDPKLFLGSKKLYDQILDIICKVPEDITDIYTKLHNIYIKLGLLITYDNSRNEIHINNDFAHVRNSILYLMCDKKTIKYINKPLEIILSNRKKKSSITDEIMQKFIYPLTKEEALIAILEAISEMYNYKIKCIFGSNKKFNSPCLPKTVYNFTQILLKNPEKINTYSTNVVSNEFYGDIYNSIVLSPEHMGILSEIKIQNPELFDKMISILDTDTKDMMIRAAECGDLLD